MNAIMKAENAIRKEEKVEMIRPMFQMRLHLHDIVVQYMANLPVANYEPYTTVDMQLEYLKRSKI